MSNRPAYGTAKIECAKRKCDWAGLESEMVPDPKAKPGQFAVTNVCPKCFDSKGGYYFAKEPQ